MCGAGPETFRRRRAGETGPASSPGPGLAAIVDFQRERSTIQPVTTGPRSAESCPHGSIVTAVTPRRWAPSDSGSVSSRGSSSLGKTAVGTAGKCTAWRCRFLVPATGPLSAPASSALRAVLDAPTGPAYHTRIRAKAIAQRARRNRGRVRALASFIAAVVALPYGQCSDSVSTGCFCKGLRASLGRGNGGPGPVPHMSCGTGSRISGAESTAHGPWPEVTTRPRRTPDPRPASGGEDRPDEPVGGSWGARHVGSGTATVVVPDPRQHDGGNTVLWAAEPLGGSSHGRRRTRVRRRFVVRAGAGAVRQSPPWRSCRRSDRTRTCSASTGPTSPTLTSTTRPGWTSTTCAGWATCSTPGSPRASRCGSSTSVVRP